MLMSTGSPFSVYYTLPRENFIGDTGPFDEVIIINKGPVRRLVST